MSNIDFTDRRFSKKERLFYARCSQCNDGEWYPVIEHRRWHKLYDYLEGAAWTMNWASSELFRILGRKTFTYQEDSKTQEGQPIFSVKVVRKVP